MYKYPRFILLALIPMLLPGQEIPRSNETTDANQKFWFTTHSSHGDVYHPPADLTELQIEGVSGNSTSVIRPEPWPAGSAPVGAKSLPLDLRVPAYDSGDAFVSNGRRVFAIQVQAGEKLAFNMKAEGSQVAMRAYIPSPPPAMKWKLELLNANRPLRSRRARHIEIKNPTSEPQTLYLILYGVCGNSYEIEMARTPEKKG